MPILAAVIPAVIGGGAAILSSNSAKDAANTSAQAQAQATQEQLAAQKAAQDQIVGLNQPYITGGQSAYAALLAKYGLGPATTATTTTPAANGNSAPSTAPASGSGTGASNGVMPTGTQINDLPTATGLTPSAGAPAGPTTGGQPDYNQILTDRPDVLAEYNSLASTADPNSPWYAEHGLNNGPAGFAQWWATQGGGAQSGYQVPVTASTQATATAAPATTTAPAATTPNAGTDLMSAGARPAQLTAPTYTDPTLATAPDPANYFSNFQQSDASKFLIDQATRGANAGYAGRGLLKSDAAVKAIMGQASGLAAQDYNTWYGQQQQNLAADRGQVNTQNAQDLTQFNNDRNYGTNLWDTQNTNAQNNFTTDRAYQTNQDNTNTGNLFQLSQEGISAAGNVSGAATNYANNTSNIFGSQANANSANASAQNAANQTLINGVAGAAKNLFGVNTTQPIPYTTSTANPSLSTSALNQVQTNYPGLTTFNGQVY